MYYNVNYINIVKRRVVRWGDFIDEKKMQFVGIIIVTILLAFISTYPAFFNHSFKLTWDGPIHLWRFEAISDALRNGKLPPIVNFMGYGNVGEAFNGIYPWLTSLIFVITRIIFNNKKY